MAFLLPKLTTPPCRSPPPSPLKPQLGLPGHAAGGGGRLHGSGPAQAHLNLPLLLSASQQEAPTAKSAETRNRAASGSGGGGGDPRRSDFYLNLGAAVRALRDDLPAVFLREPNYDIYREDITFVDPLNTFHGIDNYKTIFWALRFHGRLLFSEIGLDVSRIWQLTETSIVVRWELWGTPRVPWESYGCFSGTSRYKVDRNGKIYEHKVDNLALDFPRPTVKVGSITNLVVAAYPPSPNPTFWDVVGTGDGCSWTKLYRAVLEHMRSSPKEDLLPPLTSASEPPPLFDGTTRLYLAYHCPYAQRAWIARNCKGLQDKIKVVAIDLADRPAWYKEKVYPENKVPALEHNNQVKGESLDLVKYIESNFDGPALLPDDSAKKQFAEELLAFSDGFNSAFFSCLRSKGDVSDEAAAAVDKIEAALGKFSDGPFFLGQFSLVDIVYLPFIERFEIFYSGLKKDDIAKGRPNLHKFIEEVNKVDAYTQTKLDPQFLLDQMKEKFGIA